MKTTFLLLLILFTTKAFAQAPAVQWQKSLGGSGNDQASSVQQTSDGGYIVAGWSNSNDSEVAGNHGANDYWVVKLNNLGTIEWQKSLGGSLSDYAYAIQQTADSGYIVSGWSSSNDGEVSGNHGNADYWVLKLDDTGAIQWQKSLGGSNVDIARAIRQTSDGGYIVAGGSQSDDGEVSGSHGMDDYWVVKLNDTGGIQWQKSLGGSLGDGAETIQQTSDGGYIVAGESQSDDGEVSGNHGNFDAWIVKLNDTGAIQWQKSLGGSQFENAYSILQTSDSGYIFASASESNDGDVTGHHGDSTAPDYWIVKLNDTGAILWQKSLGGSGYDNPTSIRQTSDGGYVIAGSSNSTDGDVSGNHGNADYWIVKLDDTGAIQWQKSFGGSNQDVAASIEQTSDSGYIVAGYSNSNDGEVYGNHGAFDFWVVKLGCWINTGLISGPSSLCTGSSVTLLDTAAGGVWSVSNSNATISGSSVTGITPGTDTAIYTITKTCGTATATYPITIIPCPPGAAHQIPLTPPIFILPNPTTGYISITGANNITIKVYNTIGQLIKEASNTDNISISGFPVGLYFVRVFNERGALIKQDKIIKE